MVTKTSLRPATEGGLANIQQPTRLLSSRLRKVGVDGRNWALRITGHLPTNVLRVAMYRFIFGMRISPGAKIDCDCIIWGPKRISIGHGSVINRSVVLDGRFPLTIGRNVSISLRTIILTLQHDVSDPDFTSVGAPIVIADRVFIGAQSTLLPGISIGEGAVVAAGSVVTKDVEAFTVVAGVPAKPIGTRPRNLRYDLQWL